MSQSVLFSLGYEKIIENLHRQLGHPTVKKLIDLLSKTEIKADTSDNETVKYTKNRFVCQKCKKPAGKPIVSMSRANDFDKAVTAD